MAARMHLLIARIEAGRKSEASGEERGQRRVERSQQAVSNSYRFSYKYSILYHPQTKKNSYDRSLLVLKWYCCAVGLAFLCWPSLSQPLGQSDTQRQRSLQTD